MEKFNTTTTKGSAILILNYCELLWAWNRSIYKQNLPIDKHITKKKCGQKTNPVHYDAITHL